MSGAAFLVFAGAPTRLGNCVGDYGPGRQDAGGPRKVPLTLVLFGWFECLTMSGFDGSTADTMPRRTIELVTPT